MTTYKPVKTSVGHARPRWPSMASDGPSMALGWSHGSIAPDGTIKGHRRLSVAIGGPCMTYTSFQCLVFYTIRVWLYETLKNEFIFELKNICQKTSKNDNLLRPKQKLHTLYLFKNHSNIGLGTFSKHSDSTQTQSDLFWPFRFHFGDVLLTDKKKSPQNNS